MLILADLHLREETAETVFKQVLPGVLKGALDRGIRDITFLGDIFHIRYKIDAWVQNALHDVFSDWVAIHGMYIRILPGNHDQYNHEGRNALEMFDEMSCVEVYSAAALDDHGLWIPYRKDFEYIEKVIRACGDKAVNKQGRKVCFTHNAIFGALMNDTFVDQDGIPPELFDGFDIVLAGHYHKRQSLRNICYIGSPYQINAAEAGHDKGYAIWNGDQLQYVTEHWGRRYHRIDLNDVSKLSLKGINPEDDVRVQTSVNVDPQAVAEQLIKAGIVNHTVTPSVEPVQVRLDVPENADLYRYAEAYVKQQESSLNKELLLSIYTELSRELEGTL